MFMSMLASKTIVELIGGAEIADSSAFLGASSARPDSRVPLRQIGAADATPGAHSTSTRDHRFKR